MSSVAASTFYTDHGDWSDPGAHAGAFETVGASVPAVTSAVQGLLLHDYFGAHLYAEPPASIAAASRATLAVHARLPSLHAFDQMPLSIPRDTTHRVVGTCRDFALLTCSILRHQGVPARVRCGFAQYFHPPTYEDHWICEYRDQDAGVWKRADAQLDAAHREHLSIAFDPNDLPGDQFQYPWQVWTGCRSDVSQLEAFGHGEAVGLWFLRVNLARDLLALLKQEVSPWDTWREQSDEAKAVSDVAIAQCDQLARAAQALSTAETVDFGSFDEPLESLRIPHWRA